MEAEDFKSIVKNKKYWESVRNERMVSVLDTFSKNIIDVDDKQREQNSRRAFIISIMMYDKEIKLKVDNLIQDIDEAIINATNSYHEEVRKIKEFYRGLV